MFSLCFDNSITEMSLLQKRENIKKQRTKEDLFYMGKIIAVNISGKKGTQKKNVHRAKLIEEFGIENDAHAAKWHRQVSLLSYE